MLTNKNKISSLEEFKASRRPLIITIFSKIVLVNEVTIYDVSKVITQLITIIEKFIKI